MNPRTLPAILNSRLKIVTRYLQFYNPLLCDFTCTLQFFKPNCTLTRIRYNFWGSNYMLTVIRYNFSRANYMFINVFQRFITSFTAISHLIYILKNKIIYLWR
jgi:hypothetical protein